MSINIFIDTNIFLSFYHFSSDDLEELKKLTVLLEEKKVCLYLPEQVQREFYRNREVKIADAMRQLQEQKLNLQYPQLCKGYAEYEQLRELQKEYTTKHAALLEKVTADVTARTLGADDTIDSLFRLSQNLACDGDVIERARMRHDLRNPPGKNSSLGDAVNWEALMLGVPDAQDIYFITDDKDYSSPLDKDTFNAFLAYEWSEKKKSKLIYYRSLSQFFKEYFPEITLASEARKDLLIRELTESGSFVSTHATIAKLSKYAGFTAAQLNAIVAATTSNDQIYCIINDPDVKRLLARVIEGNEEQIEPASLDDLRQHMGITECASDSDGD